MKRFISLAGLLLLSVGIASAQTKESYTPPAEKTETLDGGVVRHLNLRYGPIPDTIPDSKSDRILDLYLPANAASGKPLPVYVFVHGGGFAGGDKSLHPEMHRQIAEAGFAVASINYRLLFDYIKKPVSRMLGQGPRFTKSFHPEYKRAVRYASEDTDRALAWIRDNAARYHLDPQTVFIGGGSAGGITVLHLAYESGHQTLPIRGVVDFWGGLEDASVIQPGAPPALIYHGDHDVTVHFDYGVAVKRRMDEIGEKRTILHVMGGRGHAQYKYIAEERLPEIIAFFRSLVSEK